MPAFKASAYFFMATYRRRRFVEPAASCVLGRILADFRLTSEEFNEGENKGSYGNVFCRF